MYISTLSKRRGTKRTVLETIRNDNEKLITRPEGRESSCLELACVNAGLDILGEDLGVLAVDRDTQ